MTPLVALLHQGNLDALGAVVLVVGFVPGLVLGYLLGRYDRREKTLDEHADDALALFADPEQADLDMWAAEMAERS